MLTLRVREIMGPHSLDFSANTHWYNLTLGITMLSGRLSDDCADARDRRQPSGKECIAPPTTREHFQCTTPLFTALLVGV